MCYTKVCYLLIVVVLLSITSGFSATVTAQTSKNAEIVQLDEKELLRDLLNEVRQLRALLQQANLNMYRAHIILERARIQQERIDRITGQLEEQQNEISGMKLSQIQLNGQIKELEDQIKLGSEPERREQQQIEYRELKRALEQQLQREVLLNEQKEKLTSQLQIEQGKLDGLNDDLAEIEKAFQQAAINKKKIE